MGRQTDAGFVADGSQTTDRLPSFIIQLSCASLDVAMRAAPYKYPLLSAIAFILAGANVLAQPVVQKAESSIDDQGCLNFEATARIEQPVDDLYGAMSRPEALWMHMGNAVPQVFVGFPWSKEIILYNSANSFFTTRPFSKIIELEAVLGASGPAPRRWIEYRFIPTTHSIWEDDIGSTSPSGIYPQFQSEYALSPSDDKSATSVRYTSKRCFLRSEQKMLLNEKHERTETEKEMMVMWLTVANTECERVRAEPAPVTSAVSTPTASPAGPALPTDTPTPLALH